MARHRAAHLLRTRRDSQQLDGLVHPVLLHPALEHQVKVVGVALRDVLAAAADAGKDVLGDAQRAADVPLARLEKVDAAAAGFDGNPARRGRAGVGAWAAMRKGLRPKVAEEGRGGGGKRRSDEHMSRGRLLLLLLTSTQ